MILEIFSSLNNPMILLNSWVKPYSVKSSLLVETWNQLFHCFARECVRTTGLFHFKKHSCSGNSLIHRNFFICLRFIKIHCCVIFFLPSFLKTYSAYYSYLWRKCPMLFLEADNLYHWLHKVYIKCPLFYFFFFLHFSFLHDLDC